MNVRNLIIKFIKNNLLLSRIIGFFSKTDWELLLIRAGLDKKFKVIFDVGTHIGSVTLSLINYFPKATIWAFEPCDENYKQFKKNTQKYKDRIKSFKLGLYNENAKKTLHVTSLSAAHTLIPIHADLKKMYKKMKEVNTQEISVVRLDDFVKKHNIAHIDLIKIDVEGVEYELLEGGVGTFKNKVDNVIIEITFAHKGIKSDNYIKIFDFFHKNGFYLYDIVGISRNWFGNRKIISSMDCIFKKLPK